MNSVWKRTIVSLAQLLLIMSFLASFTPSIAADLTWPYPAKKLKLNVQQEDVSKVLVRIFSEIRVPVIVSAGVTGTLSGRFDETPQKLFTELASLYALNWYVDGQVVYIYNLAEIESVNHWLSEPEYKHFSNYASSLKITDQRYPVNYVPTLGLLTISGPPRFIERLNEAVTTIKNVPAYLQAPKITRVFSLRFASADDKTIKSGESSVVIPGVASMLNQILNPTSPAGSEASAKTTSNSGGMSNANSSSNINNTSSASKPSSLSGPAQKTPVNPLDNLMGNTGNNSVNTGGGNSSFDRNGKPLPPASSTPLKTTSANDALNNSGNNSNVANASANTVVVMADARLNTVIVRDTAERMPQYEDLIAKLDKQSPLIEIEATIFDISTSASQNLGVDFSAGLGNRASFIKQPAGIDLPLVSGVTRATVVLGIDRLNLLAQINALQSKGDATVISRPRILSMSNMEATLQSSKEFYVKVAGTNQSNLFNVSAGLTLRVTPTVIRFDNTSRIKLAVQIDDGAVNSSQVDSIPTVSKSTINAMVEIAEGESLLIGGLTTQSNTKNDAGLPYLTDLPILGYLFGSKTNTSTQTERMFMISPKIIYSGEGENADNQRPKQVIPTYLQLSPSLSGYKNQ